MLVVLRFEFSRNQFFHFFTFVLNFDLCALTVAGRDVSSERAAYFKYKLIQILVDETFFYCTDFFNFSGGWGGGGSEYRMSLVGSCSDQNMVWYLRADSDAELNFIRFLNHLNSKHSNSRLKTCPLFKWFRYSNV